MKKITIYQRGSSNVEILDDSDMELNDYCQELSKLFQMTNVAILNTSHGTFIGRPSQLTGIVVEDDKSGKEQEIKPDLKVAEQAVKNTEKAEIQEDIITDID